MNNQFRFPAALWLLVITSLGTFAGCDDGRKAIMGAMFNKTIARNAKVEQALQTALVTSTNIEVQAWREFLTKWPLARQGKGFAWYEDENNFKGDISAVTLIEDRYEFEIILDFEISADFRGVTFSKLRFHFAEVKRVIVPPEGAAEGGVGVIFQPDQKEFGAKDWRRLGDSNWNFSAIGISVVSNAPIKDIRSAFSNR